MRKIYAGILLILGSYQVYGQQWLELYNQGVEDYNNYELESALNNCEKALELFTTEVEEYHKNSAAILRQLTLICYESDQLKKGIDHSLREQKVLQAIGEQDQLIYGTSLYNLGLIYSAAGDWEKSENALDKALDLHLVYLEENDPSVAEVRGSLASANFYLGNNEKAAELFSKSITVLNDQEQASPEFFNIVYSYSEFQLTNNDPAGAIKSLKVLTEFYDESNYDENYGSILVKIGSTYQALGEVEMAKEHFQKAADTFSSLGAYSSVDNQIALSRLTFILLNEGGTEEAADLMSKLVEARSGNKDEAYYTAVANLGNIHFTNLEYAKAGEYYQEVIKAYATSDLGKEPYYLAVSGMALVDLEKGQYAQAVNEIDKALATVSNSSPWKVRLLQSKASATTAQGKYPESKKLLNEALELATSGSDEALDLKVTLATLYTTTHELAKAEKVYAEVLPDFKKKKETARLQYASFLGVYATYLQESGNYLDAENSLYESIEIKKELLGEKNENYLSTYENLGILYLTKGKFSLAKETFTNVLNQKESMAEISSSSLAYTYNNLGIVSKYLGEYSESEDYFRNALKFYEREFGKDHAYYANTSNELALLYMKMGNLKAAEPLFQSALSVYEKIHTKKHVEYASALENLAALYTLQGEPQKSRSILEEVLEIDNEVLGTQHPLYSKTLHNLASTLEELGEYEQASRYYEEAIRIYQGLFGTDHPSYANTLYNIAVLEQEIGNYEGAKAHYEQVIAIRKKILNENHPDLAYSVFGLASVHQKLEDWESAREDYDFVINSYLHSINTYFPSLSEEEKTAFYAKIKPVFEAYQDFAIEYVTKEKGSADSRNATLSNLYDLQLSTKALLLNATNKVRNRILNSGDDQLIAKYNEWLSEKEDLVKALNMSNEELSTNQINIKSLQAKVNDTEKELSRLSESFASEYEKKVVKWQDVNAALEPGEAAIEILRIKKNTKNDSIYYAVLILKGGQLSPPELVIVDDGDIMEGKYFKQYKNMIVYKLENTRSYGLFWALIDQALTGVQKLYLSSDGVYNKININTLYDPDKKEYVFDKYTIYLLSNTREMVEQAGGSDGLAATTAQVFGYPDYEMGGVAAVTEAATERGFDKGVTELPGTLEEIDNISQTLDKNAWKYDRYERAEANEQNIKSVASPTLLHIATHGFFMPTLTNPLNENAGLQSREAKFNPLFRSGLLMAGAAVTFRNDKLDGEEDGILTAYEAMNLDLDKTELVVMSACETGLGEVKNGEGVYGLQRAFIVAGADNLIMSLWKVNDETTQKLMSRFYDNWIGGQPKQAAFHDAVQSLKNEYKEPYYWGAFVMLGK